MGEIFDASLSADHWSDCKGKKVRFGKIHLDEDEIVAEAALDDGDPNGEDFEGYTGNAGMTLERWYRCATVVIWPRREHFAVLCGAGTDAAIGGLEPMVKQLKRASKARWEVQRGRPFTLICTKATASYVRAKNIYERDLKNLSRIMDIEKRRSLG